MVYIKWWQRICLLKKSISTNLCHSWLGEKYTLTAHLLGSPYDLICVREFAVHGDSVLCTCKPPLGNSSDVIGRETALGKACGGGNCPQMGTGSVSCRSDLPHGIHFSPCTKLYLKLIFKRKFAVLFFIINFHQNYWSRLKSLLELKQFQEFFHYQISRKLRNTVFKWDNMVYFF